ELQARVDHAVAAGQPQHAPGAFEARVAAHQGADRGAVDVRDAGEVKNGAVVVVAQKIFHFLFDPAAIRAGMNAAAQRQHRNSVFQLPFGYFENQSIGSIRTGIANLHLKSLPGVYEEAGGSSPSYGNWRI